MICVPRGRCRGTLVVVALIGSALLAAADIPGVVGRATLASAGFDYALRAATASPDGRQVWFVASALARGRRRGEASLVLASVDDTNRVRQMPLAIAGARGGGVVAGLAITRWGQLLLAPSEGPTVVAVDPDMTKGAVPRAFTLAGTARGDQTLVALADRRVLAVRSLEGAMTVGELAQDGRQAWQKNLPADAGWIEAAVPTLSGGVVVVSGSGGYSSPGRLWVGELSGKGDVVRSTTVAADTGAVAALREGGYALVTTHPGAVGYDVTLRVLGQDLRERWSKTLVKGEVNPSFSVVAGRREGFVVAGTRERGLWVAGYAHDGRQGWSDIRPPKLPDAEAVFDVTLLAAGDTISLLYTASTIEGRNLRRSIRVVRFRN